MNYRLTSPLSLLKVFICGVNLDEPCDMIFGTKVASKTQGVTVFLY